MKKHIFSAPAKINLYLHLTGKRGDGYHLLDSLVGFANIADQLIIEPAPRFSFSVQGPYARSFSAKDLDPSINSHNLVVRAAKALAQETGNRPDFKITLTKNIPLESGLGGGSSDAATCLWALMKAWNIPHNAPFLDGLMLKLGADVPVCLKCQPTFMRGIGETLSPAGEIPEIPVLLIWPGKGHSTQTVFKQYASPFTPPIEQPNSFKETKDLINFLQTTENDLYAPACCLTPEISEMMALINEQNNVLLSRMSGSGTSAYALFEDEEQALNAAENILRTKPHWWVKTGWLNRPGRY